MFKNIFDAEQGIAILKVTFSCDSLPKTHFVDMQVKKNHIKSIVTCLRIRRLLHFGKGFEPYNNARWHLCVSGLKQEND